MIRHQLIEILIRRDGPHMVATHQSISIAERQNFEQSLSFGDNADQLVNDASDWLPPGFQYHLAHPSKAESSHG